jgi:hypothetical protein
VAQGVDPEFKPHYHTKNKTKQKKVVNFMFCVLSSYFIVYNTINNKTSLEKVVAL